MSLRPTYEVITTDKNEIGSCNRGGATEQERLINREDSSGKLLRIDLFEQFLELPHTMRNVGIALAELVPNAFAIGIFQQVIDDRFTELLTPFRFTGKVSLYLTFSIQGDCQEV